ncbi:MAG: glycosyltransferase [Actinomycetota bacterium]|nr:glycosyltransferase [Actinomycetota bacterium]
MLHILVMAKAPVPGRVKTRLCPPCTPEQAAQLAEAALADTLDAVAGSGVSRRILALDGEPGAWLPPGFDVVPQSSGSLDERLAAAWDAAGGPGIQIGMDTPQVTTGLLEHALGMLEGAESVLGPAADGGWWAIGLRRPNPAVFRGVAMSTAVTGAAQHRRLRWLGLSVALLPILVDLDTVAELPAVIGAGPCTRTSALAAHLGLVPEAEPEPV